MKNRIKSFFTVPSLIAAVIGLVCFLFSHDMMTASEWLELFLVVVIILVIVSRVHLAVKALRNERKDKKIMMDGAEERIRRNRQAGVACCPRCGSSSLSANAELFKAKKVTITCLSCGHNFRNRRY